MLVVLALVVLPVSGIPELALSLVVEPVLAVPVLSLVVESVPVALAVPAREQAQAVVPVLAVSPHR